MNTKEMIAVMQAWSDGVVVIRSWKGADAGVYPEYEFNPGKSFQPEWNWERFDYRIKGGAREVWIHESDMATAKGCCVNRCPVQNYLPSSDGYVRFREVIE